MLRRWHLVTFVLLGALALACEQGAGGAEPKPTGSVKGYPSSMAALGDSITAGFGSCGAFLICGRNSWSTGTADAVDSHYRRILAKNPRIEDHARSFAQPGADSSDLAGQASRAVDMKAEYVTVLIGANDACASAPAAMTSVTAFRASIDQALARLRKGLPKSRVLVASIPDVYRLWQAGHTNPDAVRVWSRAHICPAMLSDPTAQTKAAEDRRRQVRDRIDDYNDQLRQSCKAYGKRCRWDNGALHESRVTLDLVNQVDYFHPDAEGQHEIAEATYPGRFTW
ncbi:GDSL-type esterase/lipase family protein [Actinoplanes sp. NPDC051513]|uniref:GDSL-type esterase/lipase family protein n=1 Tax=Actinoplanes sp. NPDC051513 TaxID=3363908 RepID=UPI0037B8949E